MAEVIYLNGRIVSADEAIVSVNDRGFLFGDAVYEVVRTYGGRPWALERHLQRLSRGLADIDMGYVSVEEVGRAVRETYAASGTPNALIYLQITRGVAPRSHAYSPDLEPTIVITVREASVRTAGIDANGGAAITVPDLRWRRCDIKSTNLLPNVLAKTRASEADAFEAILVHPDGYVTEGSSTSVFWVHGGRVCTIPLSGEVLPGISRRFVEEMVRDEGLPMAEERIPLEEFRQVEEVFLAGTTIEVYPVILLDREPVGTGKPGAITQRLRSAFRVRVEAGDDAPR
jgi:D-alanine transaminase